jgi:sulfate adenylyltransferase subunit 2
MRETAAEFRKPVLLYSIGKDSNVMLHVALKAFFPSQSLHFHCSTWIAT